MIDLFDEIRNGKRKFEDEVFNPIYQSTGADDDFFELKRLDFINCEFSVFELEDVNQPDLTFFFKECTFNDQIQFYDVYLNGLLFFDIKSITSINISGKFTRIRFNNKNIQLAGDIHIEAEIIQELNFENFNQNNGVFSLEVNHGSDEKKQEFRTFFRNAKFNDFTVSGSNFGYVANFKNITVLNSATFLQCVFEESYFDNSNLLGEVHFIDCVFNKPISFQSLLSSNSTDFYIRQSKFVKTVNFNKSIINRLTLIDNDFNDLTFFQEIHFDSISIDRTTFEKGALFDDSRIYNINNCNRRTIRTIKQELQKAENRIDFNRFKNYEMATYYKELNWSDNFIDKFILWTTKWSTDFGSSWFRALIFTIISGLFWYSLFYRIENSSTLDFSRTNDFFVGAFRFFLVTDFHNPLIDNPKIYLESGWSWLIFILGKIFIAFGIYEMIQSFRKFKA